MSILLKTIYEKYAKLFVCRVYNRIKDIESARDIVHTAVTKTLVMIRKKPLQFAKMTENDMIRYVSRAVENTVIDYYKANDSEDKKVQMYCESCMVESTGRLSLEDGVLQKLSDRNMFQFLMESVSEEEFLLLRDAYYYEIPRRILAMEYGISEEALKKRLTRLKKRLRDLKEAAEHES